MIILRYNLEQKKFSIKDEALNPITKFIKKKGRDLIAKSAKKSRFIENNKLIDKYSVLKQKNLYDRNKELSDLLDNLKKNEIKPSDRNSVARILRMDREVINNNFNSNKRMLNFGEKVDRIVNNSRIKEKINDKKESLNNIIDFLSLNKFKKKKI